MKRMILFFILCAVIGCGGEKEHKKGLTPVRVRQVTEYNAGDQIRYSANIQPRHEVQLAFTQGGYVESFLQVRDADGVMRNIQSGDAVKRGTVLARLRKSDFEAKVHQLNGVLGQSLAAAENSALEMERATNLFKDDSLTKADYDSIKARDQDARARVAASKAQLQEVEIALRDSDLRAPIDGVVLSRNLEVGDLASPGNPAFIVADTTSVKGIFGVPDVLVSRFQIGQKLSVLLEAVPGVEFQGVITRIAPAADAKTRLFETEISIPNSDNRLRSGMIASIVVRPPGRATVSVLVVPLTSIVSAKESSQDSYAVMVVAQEGTKKVAHLREIKLGETYGDMIAITDGLSAGESVITVGATLVQAGEEVNVIP